MNWTLANRARKEFAKAPAKTQRLLRAAFEQMRDNPFTGDIFYAPHHRLISAIT